MLVRRGRPPRLGRITPVLALMIGVAIGALAGGSPASAHALAVSSDPPAGATLAQAPKTVTIVFSESPDPRLSTIDVLDTSGTARQRGHTSAVPGQANTLQVAVGSLEPGVYTVSWRTVSRVDGHLATGSFAFGVKVTPTAAAAAAVVRAPPASTWAVAARWCFYVGVMGLVGTAAVGLLAGPVRRLRWFAGSAWLLAGAGVIALEEQQRRSDGIPLGSLLGSSLGHQVLGRAVPVIVAAGMVLWLLVRPSRIPLWLLGAAGLAAMLGDVDASHVAGERTWRWFHLLTQWSHFASAGVWLGGLAVLVGVMGTLDGEHRHLVTRRFSNLALFCVFIVGATGLLRGLDEIRSWNGLFGTTFGRWALVKIGVLAGLVGLGILQRKRGVPMAGRDGGWRLRRIAGGEMALGVVVLVAAGMLQSLAPPSATSPPSAGKPIVVTGHDFATTVRVRLAISPGMPGFNRFTLQALDYDSLRPLAAGTVTLRFQLPARPDLGASTLNLVRERNGDFGAVAPTLSVAGAWTVTALIQQGSQSAEVPLTVTTRAVPVRIDVSRSPGLPTIYTIHVSPIARFQIYLDPGHPGLNEFHVTVLAASGDEIPTNALVVHARTSSQPIAAPLTVRKLDTSGHYVADLPGAARGAYQFTIDATTTQGPLHANITIPVS